jgi:hypothetical protein
MFAKFASSVALCWGLSVGLGLAGGTAAAQNAPTAPASNSGSKTAPQAGSNTSCTISPAGLNTWFTSKTASKNGAVTFANSVDFPLQNTVCDFYKWSHQMFLWMTSPAGRDLVLDSPTFYDVSFDAQGNAIYVPNKAGVGNNKFALRGAKPQVIAPGGQAGGGDTLLSVNGSLVYFALHVNDVYAWFNTAVSNGVIPATVAFPTTQAELAPIVAYAKSKGAVLKDAKALTMELKTAWIDLATIPAAQQAEYVTISAAVPNYQKTSTTSWTIPAAQPTVLKKLALVGIHVVGPVQGHPEMVWATFEHRRNAPDNDYYVEGKSGQTPPAPAVLVPYNSHGAWSFMVTDGKKAGALVPQMTVNGQTGALAATAGNTIQANNVYRAMPWGNAPTAASANNNSQLVSINRDIRSVLTKLGDVRGNYFQVGAVWTQDGSIPLNGGDVAKQIGSKLLANSTMETYHQTDKNGCFACHNSKAGSSLALSHLFSATNVPLVPVVPPVK